MAVSTDMYNFMDGYCTALGPGHKWKMELSSKVPHKVRKAYNTKYEAWVTNARLTNDWSGHIPAPQPKYTLIIINKEKEVVFISEELSGEGSRVDTFTPEQLKKFLFTPKDLGTGLKVREWETEQK